MSDLKPFVTLLICLFFSSVFSQNGILPEELAQLMAEQTDMLIIDLRPDYEYSENDKIADAVHIPYEQLAIELKKRGLDYSKFIILYDRSGNISRLAANFLWKIGYAKVRYIYGGLYAWLDFQSKKGQNQVLPDSLPFGTTENVIKDSLGREIPVDSILQKSLQ